MAQTSGPARGEVAGIARDDLRRAQMALVSARAQEGAASGSALAATLARYPHYAAELIQFSAALVATEILPDAHPTPETERVAERALARAFAAVFVPAAPQPVPAGAVAASATLRELRQARQWTMPRLAQRLGLGVDVISALEGGRIVANTVPERLLRALGEVLGSTMDQIRAAVAGQSAALPALQRSRSGARKTQAEVHALDFAAAVRLSVGMSLAQKDYWLGE